MGRGPPGSEPKAEAQSQGPTQEPRWVKSEAAGAPPPVRARKPRREGAGQTRAEILERSLRSVIIEGFLRSFFILVIQLGYVFTLQNIHAGVGRSGSSGNFWGGVWPHLEPTPPGGAFTPSSHSGPLCMWCACVCPAHTAARATRAGTVRSASTGLFLNCAVLQMCFPDDFNTLLVPLADLIVRIQDRDTQRTKRSMIQELGA